MSGLVYFLTNKAMPGLIKIGYTEGELHERLNKLNSTGVPAPFDVSACFLVKNPVAIENKIHAFLDKYRYSKNREFFEITPTNALEISFSVILSDLCQNIDDYNEQTVDSTKPHRLDEETINILKSLAGHNRNYGSDAWHLLEINNESEIEVENRLANLKELGLVEEKKSRKEWQTDIWKITSKGVKFIFDHGLVEEYMLRTY